MRFRFARSPLVRTCCLPSRSRTQGHPVAATASHVVAVSGAGSYGSTHFFSPHLSPSATTTSLVGECSSGGRRKRPDQLSVGILGVRLAEFRAGCQRVSRDCGVLEYLVAWYRRGGLAGHAKRGTGVGE